MVSQNGFGLLYASQIIALSSLFIAFLNGNLMKGLELSIVYYRTHVFFIAFDFESRQRVKMGFFSG